MLFFLLRASAFAGPILYVDDSATGPVHDGSSWCNGYRYLQDALDAARASGGAVTEIRVAQGTYKPDQGASHTPGDRTATFQLVNGVALRGGFAGCGSAEPDARDISAFESILSGDLNDDDAPVPCAQDSPDCDTLGRLCVAEYCIRPANNAENNYHVLTGSGNDATAVVDGFTSTAGNADTILLGFLHNRGGGMRNDAGSPTVIRCSFVGDFAHDRFGIGGAMYNTNGSPTVTDCTFRNNSAQYGGAIYNAAGANPSITGCDLSGNFAVESGGAIANRSGGNSIVTDCTFSGNWANTGGGALYHETGNPILTSCTFSGNTAKGEFGIGGAVFNSGSSPTVTNCAFQGNSANLGGAIFNYSGSSPLVTFCIFRENRAVNSGGAIRNNWVNDSPTVMDCTFLRNDGGVAGGGIGSNGDDLRVKRSTFEGNSAHSGGGISNGGANPAVTACIFRGNTAAGGGGMYNDGDGAVRVANCLFEENTANSGGGMFNSHSSPRVTNCTFRRNGASSWGGGMNNLLSHPTVTNSLFTGNTSDMDGGGIYTSNTSTLSVINCTLVGNVASQGGGIFSIDRTDATVDNSILWGNVDSSLYHASSQIYSIADATFVRFSIVQGGWIRRSSKVRNVDPLFVDADGPDDILGTEDDNLRLSPGSPAIDAGDTTRLPADDSDLDGDDDTSERIPRDLDGFRRVVADPDTLDRGVPLNGIVVDMGAFEFQVDCNENGLRDQCDLDCLAEGTCNVAGCGQAVDLNANGIPDDCDPDADGDAVPDDVDVCPDTPGGLVDAEGRPFGDIDRDCLRNLRDFEYFNDCLSTSGPLGPILYPHCESFDFDSDGDVDLTDVGAFWRGIQTAE